MIYYETPIYKIGKNEWKLIVHDSLYNGIVTKYLWRPIYPNYIVNPPKDFFGEKEWPKWNGNDTYCGLPRSLKKIYIKHKDQIESNLRGEQK